MKKAKGCEPKAQMDAVSDTYGVRGAGQTWQAKFGMALDEADLLFAAKREPIIKRTVFDVAHDIFAKGFTVEEIGDAPSPNWSREVAKVLDGLNAKDALTRLVVLERLFGWAILALSYVDYGKGANEGLKSPRQILELIPLSSINCEVQSSDEDTAPDSVRFGLPILYSVQSSAGGTSKHEKIHFSRVIHCATRLLDHPWKGLSVIEVLYDDQTVLRNERYALGQTLMRQAAGFADFTMKGANKRQIEAFNNEQSMHQLNARTFFAHDENVTVNWVGAAGKALNPEPYLTPTIESLSCGSRIPTAHLRGANAGTLAGSEVNDRQYWGGIAALQRLYEPTIWDLIDRLIETGQITPVEDYQIVWPAGFELTETAKAAILLQEAEARNLKLSWCTIDEIRAEEGKQPLPSGEGNKVLGLAKQKEQEQMKTAAVLPSSRAAGDEAKFLDRLVLRFRRKKGESSKNS
jgi:hypothetical protein